MSNRCGEKVPFSSFVELFAGATVKNPANCRQVDDVDAYGVNNDAISRLQRQHSS